MAGDVAPFHRFGRLYDLLMPPAKRGALLAGLEHARRPVARILDVGGGPGRAVRKIDAPERIVVDPARGMLQQARNHGLATVQGDGARLPFRDRSVDAVVVSDALHHVGDQSGAIGDAARVLRPGGVLVVREFDPTTRRGRALVALEHAIGFASTFRAPDELAAMVGDVGLVPAVVERGFGYTVVGVAPAE